MFQLSPNQQGGWDSALIYADNFVIGGLALDSADNLYSIDVDGIIGVANVFKISLSQATYPQANIYTFKSTSKNGSRMARLRSTALATFMERRSERPAAIVSPEQSGS